MSQIKKTSDLSIFKQHPQNNAVSTENLKKVKASITACNMLEFRPILVDSDMRVIDGNHRWRAAQELGLDLYYQMDSEATHENIVLLNTNQRKWTTENYIEYYCSLGNKEYLKLKEFCKINNISTAFGIKLFGYSRGGGKRNPIKDGKFKYPEGEKISMVNQTILIMEKIKETLERYVLSWPKAWESYKLREAFFRLIENPDVDYQVLISKITIKSDSIKKCADTYGYYCMIRDIYNWKNTNPIQ